MSQTWSFLDKEFLSYPFRKVLDTNMNFDLDLMTWISLGTNIASRAKTYQIWSFWSKPFFEPIVLSFTQCYGIRAY